MKKIAIVHDWLTGWRGGEVVLDQLLDVFPEADLLTLLAVEGTVPNRIEARLRRTSFLSRLPQVGRYYRHLVPLYRSAAESLDLGGYDLVLSSSHAAAKGVWKPPGSVHLCYCHTPARWAWDLFDDYFPRRPLSPSWWFVLWQVGRFRRWDRESSGRVDAFAANSAHVAARIGRLYGREARVIHPPADVDFFTPGPGPAGAAPYHLMVCALVPYKRVDLALAAFRGRDDRLVVVGEGPERRRLERLAPDNVTWLGRVTREELRALYRGAKSYLLPGEEDFGIATVEALACGRPAVALARGGATEVVVDGETGTFFAETTPTALSEAIDRLELMPFNPAASRLRAERFAPSRFRSEVADWVARETSLRACRS